MSKQTSDSGNTPCPDCGHVHDPDAEHAAFPPGTASSVEQISAHVEKHLGKIAMVFHEKESPLVHVDVLYIAPSEDSPYVRLVTSGMSDLPMTIPDEYADDGIARHAELMVTLPPDWRIDMESFQEERWYWPLRLLKRLARFAHQNQTYLADGHTIDNGEPYFEGTALRAALLARPPGVPRGFERLRIDDEKEIAFYCVLPLYAEELAYKREHGAGALLRLFRRHGLRAVLDNGRVNVVLGEPPEGVEEDGEEEDDGLIECASHGRVRRAFVCCHLLETEGAPRGFIEPGDADDEDGGEAEDEGGSGEGDGGAGSSGEATLAQADGVVNGQAARAVTTASAADDEEEEDEGDDDLAAWCSACDEVLMREGEWNEVSEAHADIKLVCEFCFADIKRLHTRN
jgi:hypothetical protein